MKKLMTVAAVAAVAGAALAAGLGPQSYVQNGLVAHFDAIDNEGTGTHNPSAAVWRDLKGSASLTPTGVAGLDVFAFCTASSATAKYSLPE